MKQAKPRAKRYDSRVIQANKSVVEGIEFDSDFEVSTYQAIRYCYPREYIQCHKPVIIYPESAHLPEYRWKVDFTLQLPWKPYPVYVEAKGVLDESFKHTIRCLSIAKPQILENLLVVHGEAGRKVTRKNSTINLSILVTILNRMKG